MLTIYKASAGSGKTFTLAVQYLSLLVENPQNYRSILAVTFTNKATEEMKQRILSQLYGLWKGLPSSEGYARQVERATGMGRDLIARRAGMALSGMIHHYGLFRVETIDAFFQTVLRGVARELGMTANWRLGLNDREVEEAAVDQLIDDLADDRMLRSWVMTFIMERMADDHSWNVIGQLKDFGENIFRDFYKQEREALTRVLQQEGFFEAYAKDLRQLANTTRQRMGEMATDFQQDCDALGLTDADFFQGKNGVPGHFRKFSGDKPDTVEANSYVLRCLDDEGQWPSPKCSRRDAVVELATKWTPRLKESLALPPVLRACDAVLRHLHLLRLLGRIQERVENLNQDNNRLLLSDTQQRLADIIDHSDTPFIYEKIGTRLEHVMIDEFQDTSRAQWQNFRLLLDETMSHSVSHNLIVGDVKQSIYRWRGGDWRLLQQIVGEFSPAQRQQLEQVTLKTNWRSDRRVVEFNNAFFRLAAESEGLGDAYGDVVQLVPDEKNDAGRIAITLFPQEGTVATGDENASMSYHDTILDAIFQQARSLLDQGAAPSDIAILVRYNRFIPQIARLFVDRMPDVPIVSDEAFRLDASQAVTTLIQLATVLLRPDDQLAMATVAATLGDDEAVARLVSQRDEWLRKPLSDLAEALVMHFGLNRLPGQSAYLCAFMDQVAAYQRDHTGDLRQFLDEWERHIAAKTVQTDAIEGIRLLSIHRSKGLEFPHVLIPFCDWELEDSRTLLWCHVEEQPFARLPLIPVSYSRERLKGTVFEPFADSEHQQNVVDNLNLLYVAFTRAKRSLCVYGLRTKPAKTRRKAPAHRSWLIEQCLPTLHASLTDSLLDGLDTPEAPLRFTWEAAPTLSFHEEGGNVQQKEADTPEANPFLATYTPIEVPFTSYPADHLQVRQSNDSHRFLADADSMDDGDAQDQQHYIDLGLLLHDALSRIATADDVPRVFQQLEMGGVFSSHTEALRHQHLIEQRMKDPRVAEWFAPPMPPADGTPPQPRWRLFRECSILTPKPPTGGLAEHHRPDRVMTDGRRTIVVDYKFGRPKPEYIEQIRSYMRLLEEMQMPAVEGYLWFVYTGDIVPVSMD